MEKHIYIFKAETGECKIGVSGNIEQRKSAISSQGNNNIIDVFYTPKCFNAHEIETIMHKYFDKYRGIGEWFSVDFQEACDKLSDMYSKYAIKEIEDNTESLDYHFDKTSNDKTFIIYLSNDIINSSELTDSEFAVYVALRSIYISKRTTQFVSYNMLAYELFGHSDYTTTAHRHISNGLNNLIKKGLVSVVNNLSKTEFELDMNKLYFDFDDDGEYYTVIKRDEVHKIMNIENKMDKFKLLRYFITCLRTLCRTQGTKIKKGIVGFMPIEYLCDLMGVSFDTNFKLLLQYNKVLEDNKIMYIYHHQNMRRTIKGQVHSLPNHYGRYEDMDEIIKYATSYEKYIAVC